MITVTSMSKLSPTISPKNASPRLSPTLTQKTNPIGEQTKQSVNLELRGKQPFLSSPSDLCKLVAG